MPETIESVQISGIKNIAAEAILRIDSNRAKEIVEKNNESLIGYGGECVVIDKKGNPDLVIAFEYKGIKSPEEQKIQFYWMRIYSTLFPHNFPRFYSAWSNNENNSGTIRQKIVSSEGENTVKYPFSDVWKKCQENNLPLSIDNTHSSNFIVGEDGGEYYVDQISLISLRYPNVFNRSDFYRFVKNNNYSESDAQTILRCGDRINQIESKKYY